MQAVSEKAKKHPVWAHFGAGNIFRIFVGGMADAMLEKGAMDRGITCVETFDFDVVDQIYTPYDNLVLAVTLNADATTDKRVLGLAERGDQSAVECAGELEPPQGRVCRSGLADDFLHDYREGLCAQECVRRFLPVCAGGYRQRPGENDRSDGDRLRHAAHRFENGKAPLAVVSMDNCSHNGEKLRGAVLTMAEEWLKKGFVPQAFVDYISDETQVCLPVGR